jgi:carbamoylphosphate synthase large subunit
MRIAQTDNTLCILNGHREDVMKEYEVELVVTNVEIYRTKADNKEDAFQNVALGDAELIETYSIDSYFDKCVEVEEE